MRKHIFILIAFFLFSFALQAQLCTGSLGDPAAIFTFGTKADPVQFSNTTTTYTPAKDACPNAGEYGLRNLLFGCFGNSWFTVVSDFTANDLDGNYMLVNAGKTGGTLYSNTATGLCPSTTYQMSVWVADVFKPDACTKLIRSKIQLQVELGNGTVLGASTADIINDSRSLKWNEYGVFFKTPANITAVNFKLIDIPADGDCGNVLILDDISFKPCGPLVSALIKENNSANITVCEDASKDFNLRGSYSEGFDNTVVQWQQSFDYGNNWQDIPGATSPDYFFRATKSGYYYFRMGAGEADNVLNTGCRVYSNRVIIQVSPKPYVQVTNYIFGCYGEMVALFASGGSVYEWNGPNNFYSKLQRPVIDSALYTDEGRYTVKVTTSSGCYDTGSVNLVIYPAAHITALSGDVNICEGAQGQMTVQGGTHFNWYPADGLNSDTAKSPFASPADTTRYMVVIRNEYGCTDTGFVNVNVRFKPTANAGADKRTRLGIPVTLDGFVSGTAVNYYWTPDNNMSDPNALRPVVTPPISTYYTLHAVSSNGCGEKTDEMYLKVFDKIIIPNAFSPNQDGINDTWLIEPLDLFTDLDLTVFNRYGQAVYHVKDYSKPWDGTVNGKPLPIGTYYYVLDLKIQNEKPMTGSITILR